MNWFYSLTKLVSRVLFNLFTRYQIRGMENIPHEGPLLVVSNHLSVADIPLIGICINRQVAFMAKEELFHSPLSAFLVRQAGSFPIRRGQSDREALRSSLRILSRGSVLAVFPEGGRSSNAQLQPGYSGAAMLALHSGAAILPVGIAGTQTIRGFGWMFRRPRVEANIGRPFYLSRANSRVSKSDLKEATDLIMGQIAGLLPLQYRGCYAEVVSSGHANL